jgi:hypothetical protein
VRFEREVAGVEQLDIGSGDVAFKGFGSLGQEERSLAPQMASSGGWWARK